MRKFLIFVLLLFLAAGGLLFAAKDWVLKTALQSVVHGLTGFDTQIRSLRLDLGKGVLQVEGLTLLNPYEFEERIFADLPELYLQMNLPALLKREKIHIPELRLWIRELNIEKSAASVSNVSQLTSVKQTRKAQTPRALRTEKRAGLPFQLDRLELTIRRVRYHDRSGVVPKKLSLDMKIEKQVFFGITDPKSIVNIVLMKVLTTTPFGNLGVNPAELQSQIKSTMKGALDYGSRVIAEQGPQLVDRTGTVGKTLWGGGKETVTEAGSTAKEGLTSLFGIVRSKIETLDTESE